MKKIETTTGKKFSVMWCGRSSLDGQLRFCVQDSTFINVFDTFSKPSESVSIKYYVNDTGTGEFEEFNGFINLKGLNEDNSGIVVTLAKGE